MNVSILIFSLNQIETITPTLCLIGKIVEKKLLSVHEVILLDNESSDGTGTLAQEYDFVKCKQIPKGTFHHAITRNFGASACFGEIIVFLNGDASPEDENWLIKLIEPFNRYPNCAAVYSRQIPRPETNPTNKFRIKWNYPEKSMQKEIKLASEFKHRLYSFSTVSCAIRSDVWSKFRFNEKINIYEDYEFTKRVIDAGYMIYYQSESVVRHCHNHSAIDLFRRYFDSGALLNSVLKIKESNYAGEGFKYLKSGLLFFASNRDYHSIAVFMLQTICGYLGLKIGSHYHRLPTIFKKLGRYFAES